MSTSTGEPVASTVAFKINKNHVTHLTEIPASEDFTIYKSDKPFGDQFLNDLKAHRVIVIMVDSVMGFYWDGEEYSNVKYRKPDLQYRHRPCLHRPLTVKARKLNDIETTNVSTMRMMLKYHLIAELPDFTDSLFEELRLIHDHTTNGEVYSRGDSIMLKKLKTLAMLK